MWEKARNPEMRGSPRGMEAILDIPQQGVAPFVIGTVGAIFEPAMAIETKLISSDERLIRELLSMLERQLLALLASRSASEFVKVREEVWPKYVRSLRALSDTMSNLVPESELEVLSAEAVTELTSDLEKQRGVRFVNLLTDQAVFTLWTLGKIRSLGRKIHAAGKPPAESRGADLVLNKEYRLCSLWAQLHLDAAFAAMKFEITVPEDVQDTICDGLRSAVNAYSIMKEALALRTPSAGVSLGVALPWDEEDDDLLASSMRDRNAFAASDNS